MHVNLLLEHKVLCRMTSNNRFCQFYVTSFKAKINQYFYVLAIWVEWDGISCVLVQGDCFSAAESMLSINLRERSFYFLHQSAWKIQYSVLVIHLSCKAELSEVSVMFSAAVKCCFNFSDNWRWLIQKLNAFSIFWFYVIHVSIGYYHIDITYYKKQHCKRKEVYGIFRDHCIIIIVHKQTYLRRFFWCVCLGNAGIELIVFQLILIFGFH